MVELTLSGEPRTQRKSALVSGTTIVLAGSLNSPLLHSIRRSPS